MATNYTQIQEFKTCEACQHKSSCKTGHACTIKRQQREAELLERAVLNLCAQWGRNPEATMRMDGLRAVKWRDKAAAKIIEHNQIHDATAHALRMTS